MSILQSEDFAIYQLRTSYLNNIHDGVGERLINLDAAFLNDQAFRAAGWNANPSELKRTYSPPIPTAVSSQYFQAPPRSAGSGGPGAGDDDDEEEANGMVTGANKDDTTGPAVIAKRRRRRDLPEEDDSSDLSDESDDDADQRPANQIKFSKMPVRHRADSSPIRSQSHPDGPELLVTSPSRPPESQRLRRGSLGAVEAVKARSRRDTATSSEISSENDLDPSIFKRKQLNANMANRTGGSIADQIREEEQEQEQVDQIDDEDDDDDEGVPEDIVPASEIDSDDSSLESDFSEAGDAGSLIEDISGSMQQSHLSPIAPTQPVASRSNSPRKSKPAPEILQDLPPPRPISTVQPVSALGMAIKAKNKKPTSPFERFATLSGIGSPTPIYLKVYIPESSQPDMPLDLYLSKFTNDGSTITVADTIGFALWRYGEEGVKPPIEGQKMNVNSWTLRIMDDGEVDDDFPPLTRTKPIADFTSNNNRANRGRSREKPWDEFGLVTASEAQFKENEQVTPLYSHDAAAVVEAADSSPPPSHNPPGSANSEKPSPVIGPQTNPITNPRLVTSAFRKDSSNETATITNIHPLPAPADAPATPTTYAASRTGATKTLNIHFTLADTSTQVLPLEVTTDTYIAEVFDMICKRLNVDKALYVLKVTNTTTVAPHDRTVEALGPHRNSLDLSRRRFIGDGAFGLSGSPGSSSPHAPLLLTTAGVPKRNPKKGGSNHPLAQQNDFYGMGMGALATATSANSNYKRYNVIRKQPMSFSSSHPRALALDGEYLHIMPGDTGVGRERLADGTQGKTTTIHFSSVVGCKVNRKHPKTFRVVVFKERETKRYDFEASSAEQSAEIVTQIKRAMEPFRGGAT